MKIVWEKAAWEDYLYWQDKDKKISRRINELLRDIQHNPFSGIGKPEPLKNKLCGNWSRRIDEYHRFVYQIKDDLIIVVQCRYHY